MELGRRSRWIYQHLTWKAKYATILLFILRWFPFSNEALLDLRFFMFHQNEFGTRVEIHTNIQASEVKNSGIQSVIFIFIIEIFSSAFYILLPLFFCDHEEETGTKKIGHIEIHNLQNSIQKEKKNGLFCCSLLFPCYPTLT